MPWFSFHDFQLSPQSALRVNLANGNLLVKDTDFAIAGPGYALRHDRFYNGLSTLEGSLGGGWQTNNSRDVGLEIGNGFVTYFAPNGVQLRFDRVAGNINEFTSPDGSNMTLVDTELAPMRYLLTMNKTGESLWFTSAGYSLWNWDRNQVGTTSTFTNGAVTKVTHASGRALNMTTSGNRVTAVSDSAGRDVAYAYDTSARLNGVTAVDGTTTSYTYDNLGRLKTIVLPSAAVGASTTTATFTYDSAHRVTKVSQLPGVETSFTYSAGQTVVTDSNGNDATYAIDSMGRVDSTEDALGRSRAQTWTANSDIATSTDAIGSNVSTYTYDGSNNQVRAELPTGAAASAAYATGVDCDAPETGTASQPKCSTDDAGNTKQYEYDDFGNPTKQTNTTGGNTAADFEYTYTGCGGFSGQVCTAKDGNGNVTDYEYDAHGNLTVVTPPTPLGATTYTYDSLGRVFTVTDGNGLTTYFLYDERDRLVFTNFGFWATENFIESTYYPNGLEHARTDSSGGSTSFEYDRQGRLTQQTGPRPGVSQAYTYDEVGNTLTYTDSNGTTTYTYDAANQLTKLREPGGICPTSGNPAANSGCILFEYDQNGAETKRILPGGATTLTARDNGGRPTRITAKAGTGTTAVDIGYSYGAGGGTTPADDRVNVQTRTSHQEQGITAGAITTYSYDARNRVTLAEEKTGATVSASWAYGYDNAGNRTTQTRAGATGAPTGDISYGYNAADQLISATGQTTTWTYDAAGQQTRNGLTGVTTTYGDRLQATQTGSAANSYFGTGNTDRLATGGTTFNSGALGLMQRTTSGATQQYTRTAEGTLIGYKAVNRSYYVQDHLGSVVGIFSATGTYAGGYSYSPYGEARAAATNTAVSTNPLRYIGAHHDGNGIYKLGARYYDTSIGRFTQMDPSGQEANPYSYASCNPINMSDPTGLEPNSCSISLLVLGTVNAAIWTAAGITAITLVGGVIAGAAGLVTSAILGIVSLWC